MNKSIKKVVLLIINALLVIPFIVFYRFGGHVAIHMLPIWFIMSVVNAVFSKSTKELLVYNAIMLLSAVVGIFACSQLYFKHVYWDTAGEAVMIAEMMIGSIYIAALTGIACLVKRLIKD